MQRYQINQAELKYLVEILEYLNDTPGEALSEETRSRVNEVVMKVQSRPVMDIVIDSKVLEEAHETFKMEMTND